MKKLLLNKELRTIVAQGKLDLSLFLPRLENACNNIKEIKMLLNDELFENIRIQDFKEAAAKYL